MKTTDTYIYVYDLDDNEIEIWTELLEEGTMVGVYLSGPKAGEEVDLTPRMISDAQDALKEMYEEYECAKAEYYDDKEW